MAQLQALVDRLPPNEPETGSFLPSPTMSVVEELRELEMLQRRVVMWEDRLVAMGRHALLADALSSNASVEHAEHASVLQAILNQVADLVPNIQDHIKSTTAGTPSIQLDFRHHSMVVEILDLLKASIDSFEHLCSDFDQFRNAPKPLKYSQRFADTIDQLGTAVSTVKEIMCSINQI